LLSGNRGGEVSFVTPFAANGLECGQPVFADRFSRWAQKFGQPRPLFIGQGRPGGDHLLDVFAEVHGAQVAAGGIELGATGLVPCGIGDTGALMRFRFGRWHDVASFGHRESVVPEKPLAPRRRQARDFWPPGNGSRRRCLRYRNPSA
jgi:hypothetical protein